MRNFFTYLFLLFTLQQINSQGIEYVQRVSEAIPQTSEGLAFYSLPRTVIAIKVNMLLTTTINGPYYSYAKELLGINNVPTTKTSEWIIDSLTVQTYTEPDPEQMFILKTTKGFNPSSILDFTTSGIMLNPSKFDVVPDKVGSNNTLNSFNSRIDIPELFMKKRNFEAHDTIYKTIIKDSILMKVPVIKTKTEAKTLKDRANEAAEVIVKIRQRRFEMIMAEDEALPEEKAMCVALKEMQKTEDAYLALFIGRSSTQSASAWFYYTPKTNTDEPNIELFRFSSKNGIADKTDALATPVYISLTKENRTVAISEFATLMPRPVKNFIYYRIPDAAKVSINYKGNILDSGTITVFQYGILLPYAAIWGK
jgi:hypothetical protein